MVGWPLMPPSKVAVALKNTYMVATLHSIREDLQTKLLTWNCFSEPRSWEGTCRTDDKSSSSRKDIGNITLFVDSQ
ncbi:hypothetical protein IFM89_001980, partial [Coptis chinensis]